MSIQLDIYSIITEITMMKNKDKFFVLVEGDFDLKFFSQIFDDNNTVIIPCGGKEYVVQIFKILKESGKISTVNVIFILDRDYDFYLKSNIEDENVFYTDYHDLDVMIMETDAFEKLKYIDFSKDKYIKFIDKYKIKDFKHYLYNIAKKLGHLRLISIRDNYNFKFLTLDFKKFLDEDNLEIKIDNLICEVKNKSQMHSIQTSEIKEKLLEPIKMSLPNIVSGHDVINILSQGMHKVLATYSSKEITHDIIEDKLLHSYNISYFKQTNLYLRLKKFSKNTKLSLI